MKPSTLHPYGYDSTPRNTLLARAMRLLTGPTGEVVSTVYVGPKSRFDEILAAVEMDREPRN